MFHSSASWRTNDTASSPKSRRTVIATPGSGKQLPARQRRSGATPTMPRNRNRSQGVTAENQPGGAMGRALRMDADGFTLIEMMAVIVILGLVMSVVVVNVMDRIEWAKVQTTKVKM